MQYLELIYDGNVNFIFYWNHQTASAEVFSAFYT